MRKRHAYRWILPSFLSAIFVPGIGPVARAAAAEVATPGWVKARFGPDAGSVEPPFSFTYAAAPFAELVKKWDVTREVKRLDAQRTRHLHAYRDPQTGLAVRCQAIQYHDFPIVEWTLYFKNTGSNVTPLLEDIQALDVSFPAPAAGEFLLHHHLGSSARLDDYQPLESTLLPKTEKRIVPFGGRGSNGSFPYFNLEWPASARAGERPEHGMSEGVVIAVGWPGQWAARFTRDDRVGLRIRAGQELTRLALHPGEEVRTPLVVLQFWRGDWIRAQNVWRRWMLAHNLPRPGNRLPGPQLAACSSHQFGEMIRANEANQKLFVDRYLEERLAIDFWWMDAGWYVNDGSWVNTGTWEVDPKRFPNGLRAITDHAHAKGVKSIVWFEPERVTKESWLFRNHPHWLLAPADVPAAIAYQNQWRLLDLGNSEARTWLTEHIDGLIRKQGIDLYRQDFNMDPLYFWRANDAADRQGITEIRYVTGLLAYWDELRRRHPGLLIDSCASGGRRNDLETMRRAVPLTRSDYLFEPVGEQCHTYGIAFWLPFYGTGTLVGPSEITAPAPPDQVVPYIFRSNMCPSLTACWDVRRKDLDYESLRRLTKQWRLVAPNYLGDYYPLTPYDTTNKTWMAWQFDRPDAGEGVVQAFRRAESESEATRFKLAGLDPTAVYVVSDLDKPGKVIEAKGSELLEGGLTVNIANKPDAAVLVYQRKSTAGNNVR
jgi:alpha-galactosidase